MIWIIGDQFLTSTVGHLPGLKLQEEDDIAIFMKSAFDIKPFYTSSLELNRSTAGRIRNQMVMAIKKETLFPHIIAIVPDNDLINSVKYKDYGVSDIYGRLVHWLASEIDKLIEIHKDRLPKKAIKKGYPQIIWFSPLQHAGFADNMYRNKMTQSIKSGLRQQVDHISLSPKKFWSFHDSSLISEGRVTKAGYRTFWKSFDSAIEFWCKHLAPKKEQFMSQQMPMKTDKAFDNR